jgi:outer membrane protein assembly factor BamB
MRCCFMARVLTLVLPAALLALALCWWLQTAPQAADPPAARSKAVPYVPDRNPVNLTGKGVPLNISGEDGSEKGVKWKSDLGSVSYGGPTVGAGKLFVGTNNENPRDKSVKGDRGVVMCFDAKTGQFLWQILHDKLAAGDAVDYARQGIASTPTVDGDRVYYVSNRCELVCADVNGDPKNPGKGKVLWTVDMVKQYKVFPCQLANCSPLIVGDLVFTITGNGLDVTQNPWTLPSPGAPSFLAANKKTGKVVWTDNSPGKNIMEGQWSNPVYANAKGRPLVVFPAGDGWLYAFDAFKPDKPVWKFNCNPKGTIYNPNNWRQTEKAYFLASPVVVGDRLYVGLGRNPEHGPGAGRLLCIDITKTGDVSPADANFDPKDPKNKDSALIWHFGGKIVPRPARGRDVRFGLTLSNCCVVEGLLYVSELDGYVHCLDAKTGEKYWTHDARAEIWATPYYVDGKVFVGTNDGDLLVFDHGKKLKEPKVLPFGRSIRTPPRFVDGLLYVMTDTTLFAFGK